MFGTRLGLHFFGFYDLALVNKRNALYALRVKRPVAEIGGRGGYRVDSLHPFHNVAERGILPVQVRRILMHNEELAACAVRIHGAGHGYYAALMLYGVLHAVCGKFALDRPTGTAHTGAIRTAALDHKAGNHPVEGKAVIKALTHQLLKVFTGDGRNVGIQLDLDLFPVFHFNLNHIRSS